MRRSVLALVVALALVLAGCAGAPQESGPAGTADGSTTSRPTPTTTGSPPASTGSSPTPTTDRTTEAENVSVEYVITAGDLPSEFESVNVTFQVVFVGHEASMTPCWRETYEGPYKPTPTPIRTPAEGDCYRSEPVTVDLTEIDGERSLGTFTAPGSFSARHGLIVSEIDATYRNGTPVEAMKGIGGVRGNVVTERPEDRYRVEVRIESFEDRPYRYWFVAEPVDGSEQ